MEVVHFTPGVRQLIEIISEKRQETSYVSMKVFLDQGYLATYSIVLCNFFPIWHISQVKVKADQ